MVSKFYITFSWYSFSIVLISDNTENVSNLDCRELYGINRNYITAHHVCTKYVYELEIKIVSFAIACRKMQTAA